MDKDSAGMRTTMADRFKRGVAMLLCCTVTWTSLPLYAQVVPVANPGGQQPGQQAAANGVPVVDIVAPNARGVSHNRYSRFDVGANGLILNNSANISKTELGGYVAGNDNLKNSGAATLILNEVTSSASRLQGYTEIAGARAQLVIANPNGISCDGCGFLNASRVTLATGTPQLGSDGALNGFGIAGGVLSVGSNGLDAYNVDRLDLLSRQLSVDGSVWAKDLLASTGTQRIGYDGMLLELLPGSDGAAPSIGIDVAYLGGMYADRIRLIATEAGVGVVSRGTLAAQSGSLQIDSAGQLSLSGTTVARDDVDLRAAGTLTQQGTLGSQQAGVRLRAAQLSLSGDTVASGLLDARASGSFLHSGRSSAGAISLFGSELDAGGTLYSSGALSLDASGNLHNSGVAYAGTAMALHAGGSWLQSAGTLQSGGAMSMQAAQIDAAGTLDAGAGLGLRSDGDMRLSGLVQSWQDAALQAGGRLDNAGQLSAGGRVDIAAAAIGNSANGVLSASGDVALATAGTLDNAGTVYAGRDLRIDAAAFANDGSSYAGRNADIASSGATRSRGSLVAGDALHVDAAQFASSGELGSQRGTTSVYSRGDLALDGAVAAKGALTAQAAGDLRQSGTLSASSAQLQAGGDTSLDGTLKTDGALQLSADGQLRSAATIAAGGDADLRAQGMLLQAGQIQSGGALRLQGADIDQSGVLDAGTTLSLRSANAMRLAGTLQARGDVALDSAATLQNQAQVIAGGNLAVAAGSLDNASGAALSASGDATIGSASALRNDGSLHADGALRLSAGSFAQTETGKAYGGASLDLAATDAVDNRGDLIGGGDVRIAAGSIASSGQLGSQRGQLGLDSRGDLNLDGVVVAAGALRAAALGDVHQRGSLQAQSAQLQAGRDLTLAGTLRSATTLQLQAQRALSVDGQAVASGDLGMRGASVALGQDAVVQTATALQLDAGTIDSRGTLDAGTDLSLRSQGQLTLAGIAQAGGDVVLEAGAALDNSAQVVAGRDLHVSADSVVNRATGALAAADTLDLRVVGLLDNAGRLRGQKSLLLQAGSFQHSGELYAGQALDLHSTGALDNRGTLIAGGDLRIDAGSLSNSGQLGSETGQVTLSSQGDMQLGGSVIAAQALSANALGDLQVDGALKAQLATLAAGRDLSVAGGAQTAAGLELQAQRALRVDGQALAGGDLRLSGASIATGTAAVLQGAAAVTLQGGAIDSRGTLDAGTDLTLRSDGVLAVAGVAQAKRDIALDAGAALSNAGQIVAGRDLSVAAQSIDNAASGTLAAQRAVQLSTPGMLSNAGSLQAGQAMTLDVGTLQHSGQAYAGDRLTLRASGAVDNQGALIAKHDLQVDAASIASSGQLGSETGQVALTSQGDVRLGGIVAAATQLKAQAQGDLLQSGTLSAQALDLHAGRDIAMAGQVTATQSLQVQAQRDLHVDGQTNAGQGASLSAGATLSTGSQAVLHTAGALALTGARIDSQGTLDAGTTLALTSSGDLALAGIAQSATTLNLNAVGALSNAGQVVAGTDLTLTAASVDTAANSLLAAQGDASLTVSGTLTNAGALRARQRLQLDVGSLQQTGQSYGLQRLGLTASGAVDNRGDLIAGSALRVEAASVASSGQLGSESGDVALVSHGDLALGGTLAAAGAFSAQAGGALSQSGALSAATTLQLQSHGDLTVAGTLSANQLTLTSDAALLQRGTVNGSDIALQAQRIDNAGQTLSSGNLSLHAGDIAIGGVAAAGVRSDGSLGSSGALDLHADRTLSASGKLIAAGNLTARATQLNLAGSTTRVGGDASLTASNGLDHRGADLLAGGLLTVRAGGSLDNGTLNGVGGQMQAARVDLGAASLSNAGGTLVQSGSGQTRIAITGAFDNGNGKLATNGQDLNLSAASLNNVQGRIEHAGTGTATLSIGGAVANAGGRILTQGQLQLGANAGIDNQNGAIAAAGDATLTAASLSNVGGSVSARGLNTQLGGALDNRSGVLQASGGTLTVRADSLDNRGGTLQAVASGGSGGDLRTEIAHTLNNDGGLLGASNDASIGAENLSNSAGTVQAGRDLALTARGQLDNHQGGRIGGGRDLNVAVTGALLNSGGQLDSGNAMTLSGGRIDNSQGSIANNGGGLTQLTTGGELRNAGGSLGGRGSVVLNAASVVNSDGQLVAGGNLVANTNALDNQRGNVYAGNTFQLQRAGATLDNRGGTIKAEQAVRLNLQSLSNSGGRIGAGSSVGGAGDVVIDTVGFDGSGNILAQNLLDLTVRSDYTHRAGADITSNGDFRLSIGGNMTNASALKAGRSLSVTANNISNVAGATMQAGNTQLNAGGTIDNAGDISASNNLQLTAGSVYNTGSLVGGNVLVNTGTLVNGADLGGATDNAAYGSALIGATNGMTLLVRDQLLNRDARIFSLGNIAIGGARDGGGTLTARTGTVNNLSGSIEADGSILIAANQLNNRRRTITTATSQLSADERAAANQTMPEQELRNDPEPANYHGHNLGVFRTFDAQQKERVTAASAEGRIAAGGNIALSGSVTNTASTIAAAGALWINQRGVSGLADGMIAGNESVLNQALALNQRFNYTDTEYKAGTGPKGCTPPPGKVQCSAEDAENQSGGNIGGNTASVIGTGTIDTSYTALAANMTGGQGVSINGATISNGAVGSDGRSIGGAAFNATQGTALNRRSAQSANGVGNKAVQAQTGAAADGATVSNRIVSASIGPIRIDDGQGSLVKSTDASAANVQPQTVQASLSNAGSTAQRQQIDPGTGNVQQVVGGIGTPLGNITLPIGGLYRLVGANGASFNALGRAANGLGGVNANRSNGPGRRYLIETDPRFVNYDNFISSDYLLDKLGVDPEWTQTRLGDGFYEQRLVLDQITQLTGRRYLGNYDDGVAQYRALLDGAVAEAGALHLDVGVALTAEQVAALTHDIVWMVEQEYQGQKVLVPVVYLSSSTALTLRSDGALLASDNGDVSLNATAGLSNSGTISGVNVSATAGTLLNQGRIAGTGTVSLQAQQDLLNLGGQIIGRDVLLSAGNDLLSSKSGGVLNAGSGITADRNLLINAGHDLTLTGVTVQAGGSAALQAGNNLVLQPTASSEERGFTRDGATTTLATGADLSLLAGNDLQLHGVAITAGGDAALQAGHDLSLTPVTDSNGKATVRTNIVTDGSLQLAAGNDITIRQAEVKAGGDLIAAAGHDLNVESVLGESTTTTDHTRQGKTKVTTTTTTQDLDQQALTAGGNLILSAGNDVNLVAAKLDAGKGLAVVAGNDINSTMLTTVDSSDTLETRKRFKQTTSTTDETVHGTEFTAGSDIALQAGHDVNLTAAKVYTDTGSVSVAAGNDVNLLAAQEQHDAEQDMQKKKSGFLSSKTTTTHDEWHDSTAVVTTLSGDSVQIAAGNNLLSQGAQVAGTGDVVLAAGNDLTLETAQNEHSEEHDKKVKKTGLYSGGGFSVTLGASKKTDTLDATEITNSGSLVGSTDGSVTMTAGNAVSITGSDVLSKTGTAIVGKEVTIAAAENRVDTVQTSKQQSAGISLGLTGGLVDAVQTAYSAVERGSEVEDDRLKALYAVKAGYSISDAAGLASNGLKGYNGEPVAGNMTKTGTASADGAQGAANATGVSLRIGIGASSSSSKTTTHEETTGGSRILSDGNVTIAATGGDLNVIGSKISGENVALAAANNLNLLSQQENNTTKSENKNAGGEIGFSVGATTGYYLTVSAGKGSAKGNSDLHTESVVTANGTLTLASGNDTTIKGAQAVGDKVLANVGGNLLIQSEQDENEYKSKQQQASVTLATGSGSGGSYSQQKVNSSYTSVKEQTGIQAGDGGFDITVGGNTHLIGGAIASTADALRNHLSTDSLTVEDLKNESEYKSSGVSVAGGSGSSMVSVAAGTALSMLGNSSGNNSSTTKSDIAAGTVEVRNGDQSALAGLDRTASELQQSGLKEIFDQKKLAEQQELSAVASEVGFRTAGNVAEYMQHRAQDDLKQAQASGDQAEIDEALSRIASWGDGGTAKTLLHGVTGAAVAALGGGDALGGALGAAAAEKAKQAMFNYLLAQGLSPNDETFKSLIELGSAALGGVAGQESGANAALAGERFNRQLHPIELSFIAAKADDYAAYANISEKEAAQLLITSTLDQIDNDSQTLTRSQDTAKYQAAANWIASEAAKVNLGFVNENGENQQAFTTSISQFYDSTLYDGPYRGTILSKLTDKVLGTDLTASHPIKMDDYLSVASDLKLGGQYQEWRATRPADISQWSEQDLNTMVGFVQKNDLRKMAQFGVFGPPGATWVSLSDGDYKTAVNDAAMNFVTSVAPVGSVGRALEHTGEAVVDASREVKSSNRVVDATPKAIVNVDVTKASKGTAEYTLLNSPPPNAHVKLSNGTEFKTNGSGYVEEITFTPSLTKGVRDARQTAVGKEGLASDVGGHIQGCGVGGTCDRFNLFPQDKNFNNSAYKKWENDVKASLKKGDEVGAVAVRFSRDNPASARPDALIVEYSINGKLMRKTFRNEAGG
ncbi:hemagglutinin repeat-containing protein [Xanthomonas sp. SS]|uniref:hemagglutinin repeat-containing protein n=1 Tax=Xanthomonas sp. SS TaxID=2724122 RepID=UPI00163B5B95|nr:hemagglutinin repeat-containing protein [Xanthomonas sp. SS]